MSNAVDNKKYVPEYVRLGIKPVERNISYPISNEGGDTDFSPPTHIIDDLDESGFINMARRGQVIDNNDEVDYNLIEKSFQKDLRNNSKVNNDSSQEDDSQLEYNESREEKSSSPAVGDLVILVNNKFIATGNPSFIKNEVRQLLTGNHKDYKDIFVQINDLIVLKRVEVSVDVSIDCD